jgi:hypothetical protein
MRPREYLDRGIREAEQAANRGQINVLCVRALAGAAVLLGEDDLADRATALLRSAPDDKFFAGAIANFELPKVAPPSLRQPPPITQLEEDHPVYSRHESRERVTKLAGSVRHIALCLEGRFDVAQREARSDLALEEVGLTMAVLGEFEAARRVMSDPALPDFRRAVVRLVLVIELFRNGRADEASALLAGMEATGLSGWGLLQLALGLAGRVPWVGYPYPDW